MSSQRTYKKLGEIATIHDSLRKPVTKSDRKSGIYPYYGATGVQDYVDQYIFDGRYVLVGEDGAKWGANDKSAYIIEGKSWVNNHAHVLSFNDDICDSYVTYFLNYSDLDKYISGAIVRKLTQKSLLEISLPVPSLSEQKSIVRELDTISDIIAAKNTQLRELDALAQALFYDTFGDPITNPKGWPVKKLGEIAETTSGGTPSKAHKEYYEGGTIPWLRSGEVSQGLIYETELFITQVGMDNSSAKIVPVDSVAIAMYGATVGEVGIIKKPMCTNQAVCNIFPNEKYTPTYLRYFLMAMKPKYIAAAAGGAQPNISQAIIRSTMLPLPPLSLQQSFAAKIQAIEAQKQTLRQSIAEFESLLAQRMDYHFN